MVPVPAFKEKKKSQECTCTKPSSNHRQLENGDNNSCPICNKNNTSSTGYSTEYSEMKIMNPLMLLPTEILMKVFEYVPAADLSNNVRLVNHRFKSIAENCLNFKFKKVNQKLTSLIDRTTSALNECEDDMEIMCLCKLLNLAEILRAENNIVTATIWRYASNDFYCSTKSCMYGGLILDEEERFIRTFEEEPNKLYSIPVGSQQILPEQVKSMIGLIKEFCLHFDQVTEEPSKNCEILSGCKMIDFLDTIIFGEKTIDYETATTSQFKAKYTYYLKHTWFVALFLNPEPKVSSPTKRQQLMHMRLRRISRTHNRMHMNDWHCRRENSLRHSNHLSIKPKSITYTGYGEIDQLIFYYGVMNASAYRHRFPSLNNNNVGIEEGDYLFIFNELPDIEVRDDDESSEEGSISNNIPPLGVKIEVILEVPLSYAPRQYLMERMKDEKRTALVQKHRRKGITSIVMGFECKGACYARLPEEFIYRHEPTVI